MLGIGERYTLQLNSCDVMLSEWLYDLINCTIGIVNLLLYTHAIISRVQQQQQQQSVRAQVGESEQRFWRSSYRHLTRHRYRCYDRCYGRVLH